MVCAQAQVLTIVARACRHKSVAKELVKNHALLPWINGVVHTRYVIICRIICYVCTCILYALMYEKLYEICCAIVEFGLFLT